jgi:lactonase
MIPEFFRETGRQHGGRPSTNVRTALIATCLVMGMGLVSGASAQSSTPGLAYDAQTRSPVPIPPSERALQTAVAESWFKVSDDGRILEGAIFDRSGNLLFCDVSGRRVLRLTPAKQLFTVVTLAAFSPGGLAFHPDGRLFIAALDIPNSHGAIFAVHSDGSGLQAIVPPVAGYMPNDLVFDAKGGFYFTDFKGNATEPKGGVYYMAPDLATIRPVLPNLAMANGLALSPDGKTLWATEFGRNLLHRIELADATTIAPIGSAIAYHFTGPAPDSDAGGRRRQRVRGDVWARSRARLQSQRHSHRPGAAAWTRRRPQPSVHQPRHRSRPQRTLRRRQRHGQGTRRNGVPHQVVQQRAAAGFIPVNRFAPLSPTRSVTGTLPACAMDVGLADPQAVLDLPQRVLQSSPA